MLRNRSREHPNDETLLAYLDAELSNLRMRAIRTHLQICWKCRAALAELESQAVAISRSLLRNRRMILIDLFRLGRILAMED